MNTNLKHTPGPWYIKNSPGHPIYFQNYKVAIVDMDVACPGNARANSFLIAAAPDLLKAVQEVIDYAMNSDGSMCRTTSAGALQRLLEAINKAKGEE